MEWHGLEDVEPLRDDKDKGLAQLKAQDSTVGERSNFKKIPMHTQDHGDA